MSYCQKSLLSLNVLKPDVQRNASLMIIIINNVIITIK